MINLDKLVMLLEFDFSSSEAIIGQFEQGKAIEGVKTKEVLKQKEALKDFIDKVLAKCKENNVLPSKVLGICIKKEFPGNSNFNFEPYSKLAKYRSSPKFKEIINSFLTTNMSSSDFNNKCEEIIANDPKLRMRNTSAESFLYNKNGWIVRSPKTFEESSKMAIFPFGKAGWCTAANSYWFDKYTRDGGKLFIISNGTKEGTYQVCFGDKEGNSSDFRDFEDDSVNVKELKEKLPLDLEKAVKDNGRSIYDYLKFNNFDKQKTKDGWDKETEKRVSFGEYTRGKEDPKNVKTKYKKDDITLKINPYQEEGYEATKKIRTKIPTIEGKRSAFNRMNNLRYGEQSLLKHIIKLNDEEKEAVKAIFPKARKLRQVPDFAIYVFNDNAEIYFDVITPDGNDISATVSDKKINILPDSIKQKIEKQLPYKEIEKEVPVYLNDIPLEIKKSILKRKFREYSDQKKDLKMYSRRNEREILKHIVAYKKGDMREIDEKLKEYDMYDSNSIKLQVEFSSSSNSLYILIKPSEGPNLKIYGNENTAFVRKICLKYFKDYYLSYLKGNHAKKLYNMKDLKEETKYFNY